MRLWFLFCYSSVQLCYSVESEYNVYTVDVCVFGFVVQVTHYLLCILSDLPEDSWSGSKAQKKKREMK